MPLNKVYKYKVIKSEETGGGPYLMREPKEFVILGKHGTPRVYLNKLWAHLSKGQLIQFCPVCFTGT